MADKFDPILEVAYRVFSVLVPALVVLVVLAGCFAVIQFAGIF